MNEKQCRAIVLERCGGNCERCGKGGQVTMHHRKKRGQGGPWTPANIVGVCGDGVRGCHGWIEANPLAAAATGWHVRPWEDPSTIPVLPLYSTTAWQPSDQVIRSLFSPVADIYSEHIDLNDWS